MSEQFEKAFQTSNEMRDAFWAQIGKVDADVISHMVNPSLRGGPRWPAMRQSWKVIRRDTSTIIASDGLSDPFDQAGEVENQDKYNGFGQEFYIETPGNLDPVIGSWQFEVIWQLSQNAAARGDLQVMLDDLEFLTMEFADVSVPDQFKNSEGRVGVIIGIESKTVPSRVALAFETIQIVNVKLLTLKELDYVAKNGGAGRKTLASLFAEQLNPTFSDLERASVV